MSIEKNDGDFQIDNQELKNDGEVSLSEEAIYKGQKLPENMREDVSDNMDEKLKEEIKRIDTESRDIILEFSNELKSPLDPDKPKTGPEDIRKVVRAIQTLLRGQQTFDDSKYSVDSGSNKIIIDGNFGTLLMTIGNKDEEFFKTLEGITGVNIKGIIDNLSNSINESKGKLEEKLNSFGEDMSTRVKHEIIWSDIAKNKENSEYFIAAKSLGAGLGIDLQPSDLITKGGNDKVRKLQELIGIQSDGHFGFDTAQALLNAYNAEGIKITKKESSEGEDNDENNEKVQEVVEQQKDYEPIAEMPRDIKDMIGKYGEWMNDKFYFYGQEGIITDGGRFTGIEGKGNGKDFIGKEGDKFFVEIAGKKYFLGVDEGDSVKAQRETTGLYDNDGKPIIREKFQIGTFEDGVMIDGTLLVSEEGKKKSETRLQSLNREHDGVHESLGLKIFNGKARLDFFENGEDTKEMSDEQLDSLTRNDLINALKLAWQGFSLTEKNPSRYGRYNLNRIIYKATKLGNANNVSLNYDETIVKPVVHKALGLRRGLSSDLDKKVTKVKEGMTTKSEIWLTYREKIQNRLRGLMEKLGATEEDLADLKKHEHNE